MGTKALLSALEPMIGLAILLRDQGQTDQAAELCLHVLRHPAGSPWTKDQARHLWSDLEPALAGQQIRALEERVRETAFEMVVARLLWRSQGGSAEWLQDEARGWHTCCPSSSA